MKFDRILWFMVPCIVCSADVRAEMMPHSDTGNTIQVGLRTSFTKFGDALGFSPSPGYGVSVGIPAFDDLIFTLRFTRTTSDLPYDAVGTISSIPVSLTGGELNARYPLWSPGEVFSVQAEAGAGIVVIAAGSHSISLGALGTRTLPARSEVRSIFGSSLPLQVRPWDPVILEVAPAVSWMPGSSGPVTNYSLNGGIILAIH